MIDLDFSRIRNHDGSQDNGFEELICQLAHLSPPEDADFFIRKDGAGGDAGVECYWTLKNGAEYAWQAKYFLQKLEASHWKQITKSVETALTKHPKITKYYICLPGDWNDSRRSGAKTILSSLDKWQEHVAKWEAFAKYLGMDVEFCFWGKHEISLMLQRDTPEFSGRARYWFDAPVLSNEVFERLANKSEATLGERYTPEYHLELPVAEVFEALGNTEHWWKKIHEQIDAWIESTSKIEDAILKAVDQLGEEYDIRPLVIEIIGLIRSGYKKRIFVDKIDDYLGLLNQLEPKIQKIVSALLDISDKDNEKVFDSIRRGFYGFESITHRFIYFLKNKSSQAARLESVLLNGEAGIGKSHLLCDVSLSRLEDKLPTVFLLAQHYSGGNPLQFLKESLDLNGISNEEMLGALDAAGEASKANTLIVIDAINEGNSRDDWQYQLTPFLVEISRFRHISVVVSCRSTYLDWLAPDEQVGKLAVKVTHSGFKGFEHRAAAKYLSRQGIVKPSSPVTSPEFTNPLFLKTCCKAMRDQGMTAFPKGLNGITSLFDFYVDSMEKTIARIKHYRPGENVVRKALEALADVLYPDNQFGLPICEAVKLINKHDTRAGHGDSLFEVLLHEGMISEDCIYNKTTGKSDLIVVRFTYERFSDHFIALALVEDIKDEEIDNAFLDGGVLNSLVKNDSYYEYTGILSALSIIVAEKYNRELVDLFPENIPSRDWLFDQVFIDPLQWRSASSFGERTLEILNSISNETFYSPSMDIILKLCTEPDHPWNAEMLHKNLIRRKMPDRDLFWSTHITISDHEEDKGEPETVVRSLIDWACFGELDQVEDERVRLCAIALIWMTSSSNRKLRDQATKSVIRLLTWKSSLVVGLLDKFHDVDDLYVAERLYAIAYGVIINLQDDKVIPEISNWVWQKQFSNGNPTPHLLLRDYARGVMECAYYKRLLDSVITPESFRPPYSSEWPLEDPTEKEIKDMVGDEFSSSIKSSIMGFPGDFGNYTMGCIHDWSPTSIDKEQPQTAGELQLEFSELLEGELKDRFLKYLEDQMKKDIREMDWHELIEISLRGHDTESEPSAYEVLKKDIEASLNSKDKEYFRWLMGLGRLNSEGSFSRKKAQRWVCKRAFDLGWTKELFEDFERFYTGSRGRSESVVERIGKKYQWIAFYEYLAHVADNCIYIDKNYSDVDHSKYYGPWQLHKRNIDPTYWMRKTGDNGWGEWDKTFWWWPYKFPFHGETVEEKQAWLWDESIVPPFEHLLEIEDKNGFKWVVLKGFSNWKKESDDGNEKNPYQDAWYRVNSCIVRKDELDQLKEALNGSGLGDPSVLRPDSTGHQGFFGEYPWHPIYKDMEEWSTSLGFGVEAKIENLIPSVVYEWEHRSSDYSIDASISIYLPSKTLIEELDLHPEPQKFGTWVNNDKKTVFFDPSVESAGPSAALVNKEILLSWLESNDLCLVWLIGGEKQIFTRWAHEFFGRLNFNGLYVLGEKGVTGQLWFEREEPRED